MAPHLPHSGTVAQLLGNNNYTDWSACMKSYLMGQDLWDVIEGSADKDNTNNWKQKNAKALHAILVSCEPWILSQISSKDEAQLVWEMLKKDQGKEPLMCKTIKGIVQKFKKSSADKDAGEGVEDSAKDAWDKLQKGLPILASMTSVFDKKGVDYRPLFKAVNEGSWDDVKGFIGIHGTNAMNIKSETGATILIQATLAGQTKIVKELVRMTSSENLEAQDGNGYTALSAAAYVGIVDIAKALATKNSKLVSGIKTKKERIPIAISSENGHEEMTRYLYSITPPDELTPAKGKNGTIVLYNCISSGTMFDIALHLLQNCPGLVVPDKDIRQPLFALAQKTSAFPSGNKFPFWQEIIYRCIPTKHKHSSRSICGGDIEAPDEFTDLEKMMSTKDFRESYWGYLRFLVPKIDQLYESRVRHKHAKALLSRMCEEIAKLKEAKDITIVGVEKSLFKAINLGIKEVVVELLKHLPEVYWCKDDQLRSMLSYAVATRQEKIYNILVSDKRKHILALFKDGNENNLLHQAGILPSSSRLEHQVSGAALQMQRELQWFQEVNKIVIPKYRTRTNKDGKTPRALFTDEHRNLVQEGEKWVKDTATSCSVVSALIATIMFAVAFTVPGGYDDKGVPKMLHAGSFTVFIISDALSLFSSSASVLVFLGILTTRYREVDFLRSVPTKLMIGLGSLFFSIATMMIVFATTLVIMLHEKWDWIVYPVALLASGPVFLYVMFQFPLLVEILLTTYHSDVFRSSRVNKIVRRMTGSVY